MEWTDVRLTVPQSAAETAEAIAIGIAGGGVYIEDYADLLQEAKNIAPVDFIDETLLLKSKEEVIVHLYLPPEDDVPDTLSLLKSRLTAAGLPFRLETEGVLQEDWENSWKAFYHVTEIGRRLTLCPAWEQAEPAEGRTLLLLDPGMAFGTGTHETTSLCLAVLDEEVRSGMRMLDVGCGSGILGIAACLLGAKEALGVDIDPVAVRTAGENAVLNRVDDRFKAVQGNLAETVQGPYEIIAANIVANAIIALSPAVAPLLSENGLFIASGIIEKRVQDVCEALEKAGLSLVEARRKNGWVCLLAKPA